MANLFVIAAPSGCGKTSLVKALCEQLNNIKVSVSHTTRPPRKGEVDGKNYFFVNKSEFNEIKNNANFLESAKVFDNYYGTAKQTVQQQLSDGIDVVLEIDWQGARQVKKHIPEALSIFILPPSKNTLRDRLTNRAQDNEAIINRRMQDAVSEMRHYNEFDYLVINDDFELALEQIKAIVVSQRMRLDNQSAQHQKLLKQLI